MEAIKLYRLNLAQLNRDTDPWEETQFNLGNALLMHGMRTEEGLQLFTEAICAFRAASPGLYSRYGSQQLGGDPDQSRGRTSGAGEAAWRGSGRNLSGRSRRRVAVGRRGPYSPSRSRILGQDSAQFGCRPITAGTWRGGEDGALLLGEAVNVYRGLLEVCTRESDALGWAGSKENLASSLA